MRLLSPRSYCKSNKRRPEGSVGSKGWGPGGLIGLPVALASWTCILRNTPTIFVRKIYLLSHIFKVAFRLQHVINTAYQHLEGIAVIRGMVETALAMERQELQGPYGVPPPKNTCGSARRYGSEISGK